MMPEKKVRGAKIRQFHDDRDLEMRSKEEIYDMLAKITAVATLERNLGNKEHASLMVAVGVGLRWVLRDYDFGLEEPTKPSLPDTKAVEE